jgi:hypothetical protein|mmetsp:Transcript_14263/g.50760  ORF Transcript_14263/g.50760 Transcript_14263/m.50760 type:complete len:161 (+) Transcript_14263:170-652(+)
MIEACGSARPCAKAGAAGAPAAACAAGAKAFAVRFSDEFNSFDDTFPDSFSDTDDDDVDDNDWAAAPATAVHAWLAPDCPCVAVQRHLQFAPAGAAARATAVAVAVCQRAVPVASADLRGMRRATLHLRSPRCLVTTSKLRRSTPARINLVDMPRHTGQA